MACILYLAFSWCASSEQSAAWKGAQECVQPCTKELLPELLAGREAVLRAAVMPPADGLPLPAQASAVVLAGTSVVASPACHVSFHIDT